ncbi:hypothetical protein Bca52824_008158 [Brassica carinata]|uniref:NYN domain-containing protein n=1 Tax=Brassica carinata TaxID=52824 RepID=A0A8X7WAB3_BRACI|nr:hypothetical protein Bca52824_008158 [Brassica carinata]
MPLGNRVMNVSSAFGDFSETIEDVCSAGFRISHCPKEEGRETRRNKILAYFLCQAIGTYGDFYFMLIIGDISQLRRWHPVLLAQPVLPDSKLLGSEIGTINLVGLWRTLFAALFIVPVDSPDTTNLMVIMGDLSGHNEFILAAQSLSCRGGQYNFLVAQPDEFKEQLLSSAKKKWLWSSLLAGRGPLPLTSSMQALMDYLDALDAAKLTCISTSPQETSQHGPNTVAQQTHKTQLQRSSSTFHSRHKYRGSYRGSFLKSKSLKSKSEAINIWNSSACTYQKPFCCP